MRKILGFLVVLIGLASPAFAAHFNCTLDATCTSAAPCNWATATNWDADGLCNGDYPHNGANTFTATIPAGGVVILATDALTIGLGSQAVDALTINGTLKFSDSTSGRDATAGFRTLTLIPDSGGAALTMGTSAVLDIPASSRLLCDTTTTVCTMATAGTVNLYGTVADATVTALTAGAANTLCDVGPTELMYHTVTVDKGQENAKVGRRILFYDGQFKNRQFEIVSVSNKTIGFCTYMTDADPTVDLTCDVAGTARTCGQRLTPHVAFGKFPDATPSANTRHWTPAPYPGNLICSGAFAPMSFCTAANAGTGFNIAPAVGDHVALIDDVWIGNTKTTNTATFTKTSATSMWRLYAVNMFGFNSISAGSQGLGTETAQDILYSNFHDFIATSGAVSTTGFKNFKVKYNAFHDDPQTGASGYASFSAVCYDQTTAPCPDNVEITDNIFYRSNGNQVEVSSGPTTVNTASAKVNRNLIFEGCRTSDGNECGGVEVDNCSGCQVRNNVIFDMRTVDDANGSTIVNGDGFRSPGAATASCTAMAGTDVSFNWIVNVGHDGISYVQTNGCSGNGAGVTHNYIANVGKQGIFGGNAYSNIVRNVSMLNADINLTNAMTTLKGNFFIGNESNMAAFCSGTCSASGGAISPDATYFNTQPTVTIMDNVFTRENYTDVGFGVYGAWNSAWTFSHNLMDLNGTNTGLSMASWAPTSTTVATISDNAFTHLNLQNFIVCSADAEATETVGYYIRNLSPTNAESTGTFNGTCTSTGTSVTPANGLSFRNRNVFDYNYSPYAVGKTGAADGSALGVRAFRFERDKIDDLWGNGLPWDLSVGDPTGATITAFPKNICDNGTSCADTDGDGVIDLHDNCDLTFNPSQYDSDTDGVGDACGG